jgi:hypothetical protein
VGRTDLQGHGFSPLSRRYGKGGVSLLLVRALDFDDDGWLHSRIALLRGVENGMLPMARVGRQGSCRCGAGHESIRP